MQALDKNLLEKRIGSVTSIPISEWQHFLSLVCLRQYRPGDEYGRNHVGLIQSGLFRAFYRQESGEDLHREFAREEDFICYLTLYQTSETEDLVIEAVEPSVVTTLTLDQLEGLYKRHLCWADFGRKITEEALMKKLRRERQLLSSNLADRYQQFRSDYGAMEARLPQHMIASFLGASPVSLSRIRATLK